MRTALSNPTGTLFKKKKTKKPVKPAYGSNPMVRKISRIDEKSKEHVTFRGISNKCLYFMLTLIIGILLAVGLQHVGTMIPLEGFEIDDTVIALSTVSIVSLYGIAAAGIITLVVPFLAFFMRRSSAVLGTIYCISIGYVYTFLTMLIEDYRAAVGIAAAITVLLCTAMFLLVRSGKVTVTNRFRTVVSTLFLTSILATVFIAVCAFIPSLHFVIEFFMGNSMITLVLSAVSIVIGCLFLLIDFDAVAKAVENEIPKEYEWYCAFSLAFSVIWLFGRVLNLVLKIMKNSRNPMRPTF
ncbi:MAG: Bax inhibitor-1/YccA family protein [Lachnospiraceae bacterium]|nr:Bax inhibitor-1/YccA family protein [Lachnospiraceae bacterium]